MNEKKLPPMPAACMPTYEFPDGAYDSALMVEYGRACWDAALEESGRVLDQLHDKNRQYHTEFRQATNAVRALKSNKE